jgi:hypothetical protein
MRRSFHASVTLARLALLSMPSVPGHQPYLPATPRVRAMGTKGPWWVSDGLLFCSDSHPSSEPWA